jgi:acyl-CoA thioester hydrolase
VSATSEQPFTLQLTAAPGDIDELGHVSNLVYLRWVQEVAQAHSSARGWTLDAYRGLGAVFVVRKHEIEYLAPVVQGDEVELATWIASWRGPSSERHTRMKRVRDGREVARAVTHWVLVSMPDGRPRRIPPELVDAFDAHGIQR